MHILLVKVLLKVCIIHRVHTNMHILLGHVFICQGHDSNTRSPFYSDLMFFHLSLSLFLSLCLSLSLSLSLSLPLARSLSLALSLSLSLSASSLGMSFRSFLLEQSFSHSDEPSPPSLPPSPFPSHRHWSRLPSFSLFYPHC